MAKVVQKALVGSGSLKKLISASFTGERAKYPLSRGGILRASEFGDLCPREEVLCALHHIVRKEPESADKLLVMLHGTALHWALQNELLPAVKTLIGIWACLNCGARYGTAESIPTNLVYRPESCTAIPGPGPASCQSTKFVYHEIQLNNEEYRIGGHPDGFIVLPGLPGTGIIEAKSILKGWEVKQCPMMGHVIQVQIYMWLTDLHWAKILYWEKGANGVDALIEHHVERDDETIEAIKETIKGIWAAVETDGPLPERVCAHDDAPRAEKCSVVAQCFYKPVKENVF